jgi:NADH-quinone oxidoreductase subunit K
MIGFLARRNMIIMFLSAEMMLQGVTINLVAFSHYRGNLGGQVLTLFILTVAACEAAEAEADRVEREMVGDEMVGSASK